MTQPTATQTDSRSSYVVEPPRKGLSLGWRVGLSTSLIVSLVMGSMTFLEHRYDIRAERHAREVLLEEALAPLVAELNRSRSLEEVKRKVMTFHRAYLHNGRPDHHLTLTDSNGDVVISTSSPSGAKGNGPTFQASVQIAAPALAGAAGTLSVKQDASTFEATVARQWETWRWHMSVTIVSVLLFLLVAMRFLVTRPLLQLLDGVRKMEMGYWGDLPLPSGAWEIRWLCWRFRNMGFELHKTVQQLVAAERRAAESMEARSDASSASGQVQEDTPEDRGDSPAEAATPLPAHQKLTEMLEVLESGEAEDPAIVELAEEVWTTAAVDAERVGDWQLKARLEDAAFRILEPEEYRELTETLATLKYSLEGQVQRLEDQLREALAQRSVPCTRVERRIKHSAGVWKKMRTKGLELAQVHDLVALRVVVPTELDCYSALGVIHRAFEPVVGRFKDYVAAPKANGYQSLHTCVHWPEGPIFEIQIRSIAMHQQAEWGHAAHWVYKTSQPREAADYSSAWGLWRYLRGIWKHRRRR